MFSPHLSAALSVEYSVPAAGAAEIGTKTQRVRGSGSWVPEAEVVVCLPFGIGLKLSHFLKGLIRS